MSRTTKTLIPVLFLILVVSAPVFSETYPLDSTEINRLDSFVMRPYNKTLSTVSTVTTAASLAMPAVLLSAPSSEYLKIGIMYAETVALTYGIKELIKLIVPRERPYLYYEGYPDDKVQSGDSHRSFLSGHTALAFAGASFTSYVFCKYHPESKWKIPVIATSYSLATATGVLRIASGNHFATDVLAGALLGAAIGYGIPALHALLADNNAEKQASPFGLAVKLVF